MKPASPGQALAKRPPEAGAREAHHSPVALGFLAAQHLRWEAPLGEVVGLLRQIDGLDRDTERARQRAAAVGVAGAAALGLGMFGLPLVPAMLQLAGLAEGARAASDLAFAQWVWVLPSFLVLVGLVVMAARHHEALRGQDLPDELRAVLLPLLEELGPRSDEHDPVELDLDLAGPGPAKVTACEPDHAAGSTHYRDPWVTMRIPLADGREARLLCWHDLSRIDTPEYSDGKRVAYWRKQSVVRMEVHGPGRPVKASQVSQDFTGNHHVPCDTLRHEVVGEMVRELLGPRPPTTKD